MQRSVAIVAHYDPAGVFDENFRTMIWCVTRYVERIIIVTTSDIKSTETFESDKIDIIKRPNIGYDFYSYKVGIYKTLERKLFNYRIVLLNSSVTILNIDKFCSLLEIILNKSREVDIVGVTDSYQFRWHIQSYIVAFSNRAVHSAEFEKFFRRVRPQNSKMDVIVQYELNLVSYLKSAGFTATTVFSPSLSLKARAFCRSFAGAMSVPGDLCRAVLRPRSHLINLNFAHLAAPEIAANHGFVKSEVLRDNPHKLSTSFIKSANLSLMKIYTHDNFDVNKATRYQRGPDGLSVLISDRTPLPYYKKAALGKLGSAKVAVVCHIYYEDVIEEIADRLKKIPEPYDVFITTPHEGLISNIFDIFSPYAASVSIYVTENRGRDIGPFLVVLRTGELSSYHAVLKLHSKKSTYSEHGNEWRTKLFDMLLGDMRRVKKTLAIFDNPCVGIVGPNEFFLTADRFWGANRQIVADRLRAMNVSDMELGFFAGSMFWFRPLALQAFVDIEGRLLDFEPENGAQDGTLAHAVERMFTKVAKARGLISTSVEIGGMDIETTATGHNYVPVLE